VRKPAPVKHDSLIGSESVFELPMPGNADRCPGTSYSCRFAGATERRRERYGVPTIQG